MHFHKVLYLYRPLSLCPNVEWFTLECSRMDTQTDRTDFITLTADMGGKNEIEVNFILEIKNRVTCH